MPKPILKLLYCFVLSLLAFGANGQVTASFTTDDTAGCAPLVVHFTSTSTGATSYSWDLGNGTPPSAGTTASTAYTAAGTYTVTLTAINGASSSTYTTIIRAYTTPTVSFFASDTSVCPGTSVVFTSTSTPGAWGGLTYTWNFGDGGSSPATSPAHPYPTPGFYNVTLFATNVKGCISSHAQDAYIHVFTPAAISFHAPTLFCKPPATVAFTNTTTGTGPFAYTWKYGTGASGTATSPAYTYTTSGSYTVSLKVTDGNGCTDSLVQPGYVNVGSLAAGFTSSVSSVCIGIPVTFSNTSVSHISSQWTFGDGFTSTTESPVHSYAAAGTYTVRLIAYNGGTCYDTVTHTIVVNPGSAGTFTISPAEPCPPPVPVTLTATIPAGCTASWIFGDGATGTGATVTHTYPISEIYSIDMVITNASGCRDTVQRIDTIYNLFLNASTSSPTSGCAPLAVNFSSYNYSVVDDPFVPDSLYLSYPYAITSYSWSFGDGSPASPLATPVHSYTAAGIYTAVCTITTANGCTATALQTIRVGVPPHASFTATPRHTCTDRTTTFTSTSTGTIDNYLWNFGDGGFTSGAGYSAVTHIDSIPGIHTVYLTVYDNFCPSTPFPLTDTVDSPRAVITFNYTCIPKDGIAFTDASWGDNSHTWIFGDGTTSTAANPVHDYPALTSYVAELATYNTASGCRDTASVAVLLAGPTVSFTTDSVRICRDRIDTFISSVFGSYPVFGYKWYDNSVLEDSVDANFIYDFHVRGLHTISLVIKDNRNCLDTFTATNYINVAKPIGDYSFTPGFGCSPLAVHFTDLSTDVAGAPVKRYFWSFGDGDTTTTTLAAINHTFTAQGTYTIEEIVTDTIGCKDTFTTATLAVNKPTAAFSVSGSFVCANTSVLFNNTSSGFTSSSWSFGDGAVSTVTSPAHVYTTPGVYTVKLVVFSSLSCTDTLTMTSYITVNPSPVASFHMNDSFAICPPLNVTFINTSTGATSYFWTLGDGTSSVSPAPGDIYVSPGIYSVNLIAFNSYGCTDTAIGHATVFGYSGAFTYTPVSGCSPLAVHFNATLVSATNLIWDFNDGTTSITTADTISHTYNTAGEYVPKLILTDSTGCTSFSLGTDTIKVDTVVAAFTNTPNPGCPGTPITFTDASVSFFSAITARHWTFAPGVTSTSVAPTQTYSLSGTFPATLSVTDGLGCTGTVTRGVVITAPPPAITGVLSVCAGSTTTLADGTGTWSISSPGIATIGSASGVVTGVVPGTATVTYTSGCSVTAVVTVHPSPGPITGVSGICSGSTATFSDTTAGGVWSSSSPGIASVGSSSGIVTAGSSSGTATISYSFGGSCAVTKLVTVTTSPTAIGGPSAVCVGATAVETNGAAGGVWVSSNTAVATIGSGSGIITGATPGTTTITYSLGGTCTIPAIIAVNAVPAGITGTMSVCQGSNTHLAETTTGGAWRSSATGIATVGSTGIVTGAGAGTDTIYYTAGGCAAAALVTVYATPSAISGAPVLCAGTPAILGDAITGGTWTSSNTAIATIGSASGIIGGVTPSTIAGTSTITYSLGGGCTATQTVIVNPVSPITGVTAFCAGLTSTLNNPVAGGSWSSVSASIATVTSGGVVSGAAAGTDIISYTAAGCAATALVTVYPTPALITGTSTMCAGTSVTLGDAVTGGVWTSSNTAIATVGSVSGIITGIAPSTIPGTATITYTLGVGCSTTRTVSVDPVSPITGVTALCAGLTSTLSDLVAGGTWSSSSPAIASINAGSGFLTSAAPGSTLITYSMPTGCITTTLVSVNLAPGPISGNTNVCIGSTTTLTDGGGGGWSSGSTGTATVGPTGVVGGVSVGTVTITYSLGSGCASTIIVTVNPAMVAPVGPSSVCAGQTITLTDGTPGGSWGDPGPPSIATVTPSTGVISGISAGTATITYTVAATGCSVTKAITVNPLPSGITGATSVCTGTSITVNDTYSGGSWASSNVATATVGTGTGTVTGVAGGTVTVSYVLGTGCAATITVTVTTLPAPITGSGAVCTGATATLSDPVSGGTWSSTPGTAGIATIDPVTGVVSGISIGTVPVTYSLGAACTAFKTVTVNPLPAAVTGPATVCTSSFIYLSDATSGGTWSSANTAIAIVDTIAGSVTGELAGTVNIIYTSPLGCTAEKPITVITGLPPITGALHVCIGSSSALGDAAPAGVWTSSDAGIAPVTTGGLVTGIAPGTAIISYITSSGCPATVIFTVNPLPSVITGGPNVCLRLPSPFTDSLGGGTWSTFSSIATVGAESGLVTGTATGTAIIIYTLPSGCSINTGIVIDTVPPGIMGITSICVGQTTTLTDTLPGGVWSSNGPSVAPVAPSGITALVTGIAAGVVDISYTENGCPAIAIVVVNPVPAPITGITNVCAWGSTLTAHDATPLGIWTSSLASITVTGAITSYAAGEAIVTYTLPTGCRTTDTFTVYPLPGPVTGPDHICIGSATVYTDTSLGGVWSSANTSVATILPGTGALGSVSPGNTVVTYTLPVTGCKDSVLVTVYPHPSVITGTAGICTGATSVLSDSVAGGAWSTAGSSSIAIDPVTGIVTGFLAGTATITYTLAAGCTATKLFTVFPLPAVHIVTGGGSYCAGGTGVHVGLNGSDAGIRYLLYHSAAATDTLAGTGAAIDFGLITAAGDYTVVAANATTACTDNMTDSAIISITPVVIPTVSIAPGPNDTICAGAPMTFTATAANGGIAPWYQWSVNGTAAGTGTAVYSYTPANDDVVSILLASHAVCAVPDTVHSAVTITAVSPVALVVNVTADPGTAILAGESATLTATVTNGSAMLTYQWVVNGTQVSGATTATYTSSNFANGDSVSCMVTSDGYCNLAGAGWVIITISNEGVKPLTAETGITILPNPSKGEFTIKGTLGTIADEEAAIEITDMLGQVVYKDNLMVHNGKINQHISLGSAVANGMYLLNLRSASGNEVFHIVVEQ